MTAGTFDFATLASSSLPAVSGGSSWYGAAAPAPAASATGVPSFLSRGGIDANRMQQLSHGLQATSAPTSTTSAITNAASANRGTGKFVSVEDMIHQRRSTILNKLVTDQMLKTRERCDKMHAKRMKKNWDDQKELYMKELVGDRRLGGSSTKKYESMTATNNRSNSTTVLRSQETYLQHQLGEHLNLVTQMNQKSLANNDAATILYSFTKLAATSPSYSAAWKLVYALQQGKSDTPLGRGIATMSHLARQYRAHVENRVRAATSSGQVVPTIGDNKYTGMAHTVATYVQLTVGSSPGAQQHWAIMYYCLRCGDFVAAKQVMDANNTGGHELSAALETYARQQGAEPFFWDQVTFVNAITPITGAGHQNLSSDHFEEACWSLLSGGSPEEASPLVKTIEDFVYVSMWDAIFGGTEAALIAVGTKMVELGKGHFQGDDATNAWAYAMPLLLTQQYRASMLHLAKEGGDEGVLQATHLSLFLPELEEPSLLSSLLIKLASNLKEVSASSALEYLVRIPDQAQQRTQIVDLIVESRQFEMLGGILSGDGVRKGETAALDRHFPPNVVCGLLEQAALLTRSRYNNMADTLELLNLANRYTSLLTMLNEQLASLLAQDPSAEKDFWLKASKRFDAWHFSSGRRTHAVDVLEANNSVALVGVFRTLLKLFTFIDRLTMQDFEEATTIIDGLHMLPRSSDEQQAKVGSYEQMNPVLKGVFPSIVLGAMQALYQQFIRAKHSGVVVRDGATGLQQLKSRAALLNSFASALDLPYDLVSQMANMEAQMI